MLTSVTPAAASVVGGGPNGTTTTVADAYGATAGADGVLGTLDPSSVPGADAGARCTPVLTVTKSTSTPNVVNSSSGTTATYTIRVENEIARAPATAVSIADVLPTGFSYLSTTTVGLTGSATRDTTVDPAPGATTPDVGLVLHSRRWCGYRHLRCKGVRVGACRNGSKPRDGDL